MLFTVFPASRSSTPPSECADPPQAIARHIELSDLTSSIILGFADGLTVPFALTAGLSSLGSSHLVILGGLAELFSGSISMGLGAYLAAQSDSQRYDAEVARIKTKSTSDELAAGKDEVVDMLMAYGASDATAGAVVGEIMRKREGWVKFHMDMILKLQKPAEAQAVYSALAMGLSYIVGGILPMIPYFIAADVTTALFASIGITVGVLLVFGFVKTRMNVGSVRLAVVGALQTLLVGVVAAGASYGIVRAVDSRGQTR